MKIIKTNSIDSYLLKILPILLVSLFISNSVLACDPCALYNASRLQGYEKNSLNLYCIKLRP